MIRIMSSCPCWFRLAIIILLGIQSLPYTSSFVRWIDGHRWGLKFRFTSPLKTTTSRAATSTFDPSSSTRADVSDFVFIPATRLNLGTEFEISEFLDNFSLCSMYGVFLLSSKVGEILYISSGNASMVDELYQCLEQEGSQEVYSIQAQSFSVANRVATEAYRTELLKHLGGYPPGNANWGIQVAEKEGTSTLGMITSDTGSVAAQHPDSMPEKKPGENAYEKEGKSGFFPKSNVNTSGTTTVISPFETQHKDNSITQSEPIDTLDLNVENVEKVLDKIRPYLINDGGNVEIVEVDLQSGDVILRLQGACGSCPSSTTTMKMGIERTLRENFKSLGEVIAAPPDAILNQSMIDEKVRNLIPAINSLGGVVEFGNIDAENGIVHVRYKGPEKLIQGLIVIMKEIDEIKEVKIHTLPS